MLTQTTTPTAASLLIDALPPKHRALLFNALNAFSVFSEAELESATDGHLAPTLALHISSLYRWNIAQVKEIKKILFAECFPEDLKLEQHIYHDIKANEKAVVPFD